MITVSIFINQSPVFTRSARNVGPWTKTKKQKPGDWAVYHVDDGRTIVHCREHGALELARKMLKPVEEP